MSIHRFPDVPLEDFDVCIVGSGPAGLSVALEFADTALSICVLESGGRELDPAAEALNEIESVGLRRAPQDVTRRRGFGGTSAVWSGRCGVFDAIDFAARPWVPHSGWPIDDADVAPYLDRASRRLELGPAFYREDDYSRFRMCDGALDWRRDIFRPVIWQFSASGDGPSGAVRAFAEAGVEGAENIGALQHAGAPKPRHFGESYASVIEESRTIKLVLGANVTAIDADLGETRARGVTVKAFSGETAKLRARVVVLACGGIDNARLLLCSPSAGGRGLGNARDQVGRYLTDHPFGAIASYHGEGSKALRRRLGHRWLQHDGSRRIYSLGLRLAPELQRREELLNAAIHIVERGERSSAIMRAGAAARLAKARRFGRPFLAEAAGALSDPLDLVRGVYDRYVRNRPHLERPDRIDFGCVVEQAPDPESRVTLSSGLDALGMPRAQIDWRASDREYWTARRMAELLRQELARLKLEPPVFAPWLDQGPDAFRRLIHDMAHPMGATRMSASPSQGVVDRNCQVHGVSGLFVAGGSVFPTSGYMNPTLMIVALSVRLADHIKRVLAAADAPPPAVKTQHACAARPAFAEPPRRARVAFVGVGDRVRTIYVPVLSALESKFEIVGATSRSPDRLARFGLELGVDTFSDAASMVRESKPDFIVVAVSPHQVEAVLPSLIGLGTPLLVETPIAWSLRRGRAVVRAIDRARTIVGVAEQTPFLPAEQLKRRLIELGVIGCVGVAENDFAVYDYHGVAAARAYLAGRRALSVSATVHRSPIGSADGSARSDLFATVAYDDGSTLVHRYGDVSATSPLREPRGLRVFGSDGTLSDETLIIKDASGARAPTRFERDEAQGGLNAISVETPLGRVTWRNPFAGRSLSDEQIAVAALLTDMSAAAAHRRSPAYDAHKAFQDMEMLAAMRLSALRGGRSVRLPVGMGRHALHTAVAPMLARFASLGKATVLHRLGRFGATT